MIVHDLVLVDCLDNVAPSDGRALLHVGRLVPNIHLTSMVRLGMSTPLGT